MIVIIIIYLFIYFYFIFIFFIRYNGRDRFFVISMVFQIMFIPVVLFDDDDDDNEDQCLRHDWLMLNSFKHHLSSNRFPKK